MEDYKTRMVKEGAELLTKVTDLQAFIDGDVFRTLSKIDQDLLRSQLTTMREYLSILQTRISRGMGDE